MNVTLTKRRQQFVVKYVELEEGRAAAIAAGYGEAGASTEAHRLLKNPEVQAAIAQERENIHLANGLTHEYVIAGLMKVYAQALTDKAYPSAVSALTQLGKHLGMFSDRVDVSVVHARAAELATRYGIDPDELTEGALKLLAPPESA